MVHTLTIRAAEIEGEPWFVAADVAALLYGTTTGLSHIYARLSDAEQQIIVRGKQVPSHLFSGKAPKRRLISESGLYKLVMRSDKPEAKEFQHWVTSVVLPAIRKDGGYIQGNRRRPTRCASLGTTLARARTPIPQTQPDLLALRIGSRSFLQGEVHFLDSSAFLHQHNPSIAPMNHGDVIVRHIQGPSTLGGYNEN